MNDFTLEELEDINLLANENGYVSLHFKSKYMIENYQKKNCDHKSNYHYYTLDGKPTAFPTDIYKCKYCEVLFKFIFENGKCVGHEEVKSNE